MACENNMNCSCTATCSRRGKCCACVAHHKKRGEVPGCLFSEEGEKTHDRSLANFCRDKNL